MAERFVLYEPRDRFFRQRVGDKEINCFVTHSHFVHGGKEYLIKLILRRAHPGGAPLEAVHAVMEARIPFEESDVTQLARKYVAWEMGGRRQWRVRSLSPESEEFGRVARAFEKARGKAFK
ncbi:MAG: hypothetical protein AB1626_01300 [Candidatus Micrarchaeota archaeon]